MAILGISDIEHDTAAVLLGSDGIISAIEEDKLSRSAVSMGLPRLAIMRCLDQGGIRAGDLGKGAIATRPRRAWFQRQLLHLQPSGRYCDSERANNHANLIWKLQELGRFPASAGLPPAPAVFDHHVCHAASAYYPSPFDRALVLTLDECGDMHSGSLAIAEGARLRRLGSMRFPNSLGWFYARVTQFLGFHPSRDEHKVQWLSTRGQPSFLPVLRKLFRFDSRGFPVLNPSLWKNSGAPGGFSAWLRRQIGISDSAPLDEPALRADLARSAQDLLEEIVIRLAETYRQKTAAQFLCLAGGVFMNVLLVRALELRTAFDAVFAQPVAGNPGTAWGAALLAHQAAGNAPARGLPHLYLGPAFDTAEIKAILDNCKTIYRYLPEDHQLIAAAIDLLHDHKIVAWYQGRLEFGHRALGNRSILGSPFSPYVMENLNRWVKHREDFHPFGLSVPAEDAPGLFDCTPNSLFMSSLGELRETLPELRRFAFNGRSVRVHTVARQANPRFWQLLRKFGESAPAPVLVNTSFNLFGEPLVCDPREAIRSLYCSGIDALVMGNFLLAKL